ncbi:ATP-binding cassette domain-containing protein [Kineococcus sp. R8]|nr:ATP-binding cassette domain-containing protein [Kineococcus siccus]
MPHQTGAPATAVASARSAGLVRGSVEALRPTSFALAPGRCLAVVGPNGSGKSTLLDLLAGRARPTSGAVEVLGRPADEARRACAADVSVLLAGFACYPDLTVREHLELVAAAWPAGRVLAGVDEVLAATGLGPVRGQFPDELSSGESQVFALACATMRPARLLLLDEPEQRLDADRRAQCLALLRRVKARGISIVVATHSRELRDGLADEVLALHARDAA